MISAAIDIFSTELLQTLSFDDIGFLNACVCVWALMLINSFDDYHYHIRGWCVRLNLHQKEKMFTRS